MICIPIKKKTFASTIKTLKEAEKIADIIEIWFDEIKDLTAKKLDQLFCTKKLPIIYKVQNGKQIKEILSHKIEYIDLDISAPRKTVKEVGKISKKTKIIISYHNFTKTPDKNTLKRIIKKILKKDADIIKLATTAKSFEDSLRMLELIDELSKKHLIIGVCMGKRGEITRTSGHLFGNYLMYAPIKKTDKTARGQIDALTLKKIWRLKSE